MNFFFAILFALFLVPSGGAQTDAKGEVKWSVFNDGIKQAKNEKKKVVIDIYTDWCGWCKKLDKEVYANKAVAAFLNDNYVIIKLNAESSKKVIFNGKSYTEQQLAAAFGATGYPTIVFLESDSKVITSLGGYVEAERFLKILKFLGKDYYKTMKWDDFLKNEPKD